MGSPFSWSSSEPGSCDPLLFRHFFSDIACKHLPCEHAELVGANLDEVAEAGFSEESRDVLALVRKNGKPVIDSLTQRLFLPLFVAEKLYGIAILAGGEAALYQKFTSQTMKLSQLL